MKQKQKQVTQGQIDTPLTEHGKRQAEQLAGKLKDIRFDAIYSSDLGRAFITEFIIAQLDHEESLIHETSALRELNYGIYNDHTKEEILAKCPQHLDDPDFVFPQGESFHQMQKRVIDFLQTLTGTVLIVTHSGAIRAILDAWTDEENLMRKKISHDTVFYIERNHETITYRVF